EQVRVDRADPDPELLGIAPQLGPVVDAVPGDVDRHARAAAGQPVDEGGIRDPLPDRSRGAGPRIDVESRARVAVAPGRRLDLESPELRENGVVSHAHAVITQPRLVVESAFDSE